MIKWAERIGESMGVELISVLIAVLAIGVTRNTLSQLLNGHAGVSPTMALALERIGWSDAEHWVRMQGSFHQDFLQANFELSPRHLLLPDNSQGATVSKLYELQSASAGKREP